MYIFPRRKVAGDEIFEAPVEDVAGQASEEATPVAGAVREEVETVIDDAVQAVTEGTATVGEAVDSVKDELDAAVDDAKSDLEDAAKKLLLRGSTGN